MNGRKMARSDESDLDLLLVRVQDDVKRVVKSRREWVGQSSRLKR